MLPDRPVVLASEQGPEYYVANEDLSNPAVLNYVRAIENIRLNRTGKLPQKMEGGFTDSDGLSGGLIGSSSTNQASTTTTNNDELAAVMLRLVSLLERGIVSVIPDDTIQDVFERFDELDRASGGILKT